MRLSNHQIASFDEPIFKPCTATSRSVGTFFNLQPLIRKHPDTINWQVRGIDYPANFTLNICKPLLLTVDQTAHSLKSIVDSTTTQSIFISSLVPTNTSSVIHYQDGTIKSLGISNDRPYFRGRNLLLEYHNGFPCVGVDGRSNGLNMSTLISFKCDHDTKTAHVGLSFLGSTNNCTFLFEARSVHASPSMNEQQSMASLAVFFVICCIALFVYVITSVFPSPYQRNRKSNDPVAKKRLHQTCYEPAAFGCPNWQRKRDWSAPHFVAVCLRRCGLCKIA